MRIIVRTLFIIALICPYSVHAQDSISIRIQQYSDSLSAIRPSLIGRNQSPWTINSLLPIMRGSDLEKFFSLSASSDMMQDHSRQMVEFFLNHPEHVFRFVPAEKILSPVLPEEEPSVVKKEMDNLTDAPGLPSEPIAVMPVVEIKKPNFWTYGGDYYLQFLQNYISSNWYKGGESSYSMVGSATFSANYNNKQKVKWDNTLELKLGFQTSRTDSLHQFKTTEDLIRLTSKFGLQATKRWYYTLQFIGYTQFTRGYKNNDAYVYSDFMSPLNLNISLGMDYSVEALKSRLTGNVHLAPLAFNFRYVNRTELGPRYGLDEGKHTLLDKGSQVTIELLWKFSDNISWKTRLYGYTTYKRSELEWENTFSFKFNRFISANIFVYPRFDDNATRQDGKTYWQLKEYTSLGFSYSF